MQKQTSPTYGQYIGKEDRLIADRLIEKYGSYFNPIILNSIQEDTLTYLYELTVCDFLKSQLPGSKYNRISVALDFENKEYYPKNQVILPFEEILKGNQSYDFIQKNPLGKYYRTVDVDYLWRTRAGWKAVESTTFFVEFNNLDHARNLIKKMNRRPSWASDGALAWKVLEDVADDFNAEAFVVCMNSESRHDYSIKKNSKAYIFPLNRENIERIANGDHPLNDQLLTYKEFVEWL